jgi:hypothetical protein
MMAELHKMDAHFTELLNWLELFRSEIRAINAILPTVETFPSSTRFL